MTVRRLDDVLDAKPPKPRRPVPSVPGVRFIPRPCSCTWRLTLGAYESTWTLTETDRFCPMHGLISDEKSGAGH